MSFPVDYFNPDGNPKDSGDGSVALHYAADGDGDGAQDGITQRQFALAVRSLQKAGFVVTKAMPEFGGQIARVQIDAYGESAAEAESTLLAYATRCDAASQAFEVAYGRCVIERNLEEEWGATYSWRGRLILHPTIGTQPSSSRAAAAIGEALDRDPR